MSLLLLGIRINEAVTEMGPKNSGSRFRVEIWCSLWALATTQSMPWMLAQTTPPFSYCSVRLLSQ